jgi:hypothetical protein
MPSHGLIVFAVFGLCISVTRGADATTPVDYTQRNSPYSPAGTVAPEKQTPATNEAVQEKRVEKTIVEKQTSSLADRRAPLEVKETRDKQVREKDSHRPEKIETPTSKFNHQQAAISTGADTTKPPTVAKYQDGLTAASATNMARFPAVDRATGAKINRFVFRKNPDETRAVTNGAEVTPAAGGSVIRK